MKNLSRNSLCALFVTSVLGLAQAAHADIVITEVDPFGSASSSTYGADWFMLTNTGSSAVSLSSLTMTDDHADSNAANVTGTTAQAYYASGATISTSNLGSTYAAASLTLANGATTLGAGQSAIFLESNYVATNANSSTIISNFEKAWFGSNVPSGLLVGTYDDGLGVKSSGAANTSEYGLSQTNDMVNIFQSGSLVASVGFGTDAANAQGLMATFDNTAGLNKSAISTMSVVGTDGAFESASKVEVGFTPSPVPLPGSLGLMLGGLGCVALLLRRRVQG